MLQTTKNFCRYMDAKDVRYDAKERDGKSDWVNVKYKGDNASKIDMQFFFGTDEGVVALRVFSIVQVPGSKTASMLELLNELMQEYRWLRFYLDSDNEVTAAMDAVITPETSAPVTFEMLSRTVSIVDDIYPRLMKLLWA